MFQRYPYWHNFDKAVRTGGLKNYNVKTEDSTTDFVRAVSEDYKYETTTILNYKKLPRNQRKFVSCGVNRSGKIDSMSRSLNLPMVDRYDCVDALMLWSQRKDHAEVARHWGCGEHCIGENLRKVSMTAVLAAFMLHVLFRSLFLHRLASYLVLSDGYYIWHSQIWASSSNLRPYIIVGTCWLRGWNHSYI